MVLLAPKWRRVSLGRDTSGRPVTVNRRTSRMLAAAARLAGVKALPIAQGSYMRDVPGKATASAGTHDLGGPVDISVSHLPAGLSVQRVLLALRRVGFAAWHRLPSQGPWVEHIHAVPLGDKTMTDLAKAQEVDYRAGRNGLAGHGLDDGPRVHPILTWEEYRLKQTSVSGKDVREAARVDRRRPVGSHPRQTRLVQKALGMRLRTGRWGRWTRAAYEKRFPRSGGVPTDTTLGRLAPGYFTLIP